MKMVPRMFAIASLALAGLALVAFRMHAFSLPLETDECNYAYIAARLLEGQRLYVDVWDHQPFGIFLFFAGLIAAFGDAPEVFRWTALACSFLSLLTVWAIVRRLCGWFAAALAAIVFAVVSSDPGTGGEGANREIYMNVLILAAWYFAVRWAMPAPLTGEGDRAPDDVSTRMTDGSRDRVDQAHRGKTAWLLASGTALAVASSIKTIVAIHWAFLAAWVAWVALRRGYACGLRAVIVLGIAPAAFWAGAWIYFTGTGRGSEFVEAVLLFNIGYTATAEPFLQRFLTFFRPPHHPFIFDSALPLWIAAAAAALALIVYVARKRSLAATGLFLYAVSSYLAVCMPGRFWPHYYYLLIPPCVMLAASLVPLVARRAVLPPKTRQIAAGAIGLVLAGATLIGEYRHYLSQPPFGITVRRYNSRDFWGRAQGENVARVTEPGDRVFVYGNEAEIYYYSGRRCPSRYTMITGLAEGMHGAAERRAELIRELSVDPPRLVILLFDQPPFPQWRAFLEEHYSSLPAGVDFNDETGEPIMLILTRKDRPIQTIDWNWDRSAVGGWSLKKNQR